VLDNLIFSTESKHFCPRLQLTWVQHLTLLLCKERLLAQPANIILGLKRITLKNTLAYYITLSISNVSLTMGLYYIFYSGNKYFIVISWCVRSLKLFLLYPFIYEQGWSLFEWSLWLCSTVITNPTQASSTQPNPTQPNPTQPNPTQPNPTQPNLT
jgi:hypothetical protein